MIETQHGSSHSQKDLKESVHYIDEQFRDYLTYGELTEAKLKGKRILELGFGDNLGVALRFLAAGAERVVGVDKFYSTRDVAREREIYRAIREQLKNDERDRFDSAVDLTAEIKFNAEKLKCINGLALESAASELVRQRESFDVIISRAVLEEIYNPHEVFLTADKLLAPGGLMMHKIDLSDYGMFSAVGMHPLTFLTIPESVYRLMATDSGIPNRKTTAYYQREMEELGYEAKYLVTSLVSKGSVVPHRALVELNGELSASALRSINAVRSKLSNSFIKLPDEELMVSGIFLIARKPLAAA